MLNLYESEYDYRKIAKVRDASAVSTYDRYQATLDLMADIEAQIEDPETPDRQRGRLKAVFTSLSQNAGRSYNLAVELHDSANDHRNSANEIRWGGFTYPIS